MDKYFRCTEGSDIQVRAQFHFGGMVYMPSKGLNKNRQDGWQAKEER
jgi:hypothetical protein